MKTAMIQFLEWLENSSDVQNDILNWETVKENAVEKEKKQMIDSFKAGMDYAEFSVPPNWNNEWDEYYNQTYNQNK
jgi:hypothetical protein